MAKAFGIFYLVMAIATYGNVYHGPTMRALDPGGRATWSLVVAPFWPLYWSTVLFEP